MLLKKINSMKIKFYYLALLFFIVSNSNKINAQKRISLDENWKFHFGNSSDPEKDFNYITATIFSKSGAAVATAIETKFIDSTWTNINLPHDWAVELPFENSKNFDVESHGYKPVGGFYPETSIGWYRKHFKVDKINSQKRFEIQFDGIFRNATIWINGFYVGTNLSGYIGKSYDVTDYINFDKENIIVVRVDASQYEGWFYEGAGIYRHVWLTTSDKLHILDDGLFVHAIVNNKNASVTIETEIENKNLIASKGTIYTYVTDRNGKQITKTAEQNFMLAVNGKTTIKQNISINNANLWSLENPYLYKVISVIKQNNQIVDQKKVNFGIRTIKFDANEGFLLHYLLTIKTLMDDFYLVLINVQIDRCILDYYLIIVAHLKPTFQDCHKLLEVLVLEHYDLFCRHLIPFFSIILCDNIAYNRVVHFLFQRGLGGYWFLVFLCVFHSERNLHWHQIL